jgi:nicotinate phosphoribosyltransferase
MKLSTGKVTLVDKKQVFRHYDDEQKMRRDVIALRDEGAPGAEPLLQPVMRQGRISRPQPTLQDSRAYFQTQLARLPEAYKALKDPPVYPVELSPGLRELQSEVEGKLRQRELGEN